MTGQLQTMSFFVAGVPISEGSMQPFIHRGRPRARHENPRLAPWRRAIVQVAARAWRERCRPEAKPDRLPPETSVHASLLFVVPRPRSHYGRSGRLLPSAPAEVATGRQGDLDKLIRAVLDALKDASVLHDDSQVNHFLEPIGKEWVSVSDWWGGQPGVHVRLEWVERRGYTEELDRQTEELALRLEAD